MSYRRENEVAVIKLVREFERIQEKGERPHLDEKTYEVLIDFYENELMFDKALEVMNLALEHYGDSAHFHIKKANLLLITRNSELAMSTLNIAQSISPQTTSIQLLKVKILATMEKHIEALAVVNEIKDITCDIERSQVLYTESLVYELMKDYDRMFIVLEESLFLDPENKLSLEKIWVCTELTRNYKRSIDFHKRLINVRPYNYLAWYNLGQAYSCIGDNDLAIDAYEYVNIINPNFEPAYEEMAEIYLTQEDYKNALQVYIDQLAVFGADHEIYRNLGECYLKLEAYSKAKNFLLKAHKLDHYNDEVMFCLGIAFYRTENYQKAHKYLLEAVNLEDRNEEYYMYLGLTLIKLEEFAKANYFLKKATEVGPDQIVVWVNYLKFLNEYESKSIVYKTIAEGQEFVEESDLTVIKIALMYRDDDKDAAIQEMITLFEEEYDLDSSLLEEFCPGITEDDKIKSIIRYYEEG